MKSSAALAALSSSALLAGAAAQAPAYTVELVGPGVLINDMNLAGEVVGWTTAGGAGVQAFVAGPDHPFETLPLPAGYASAWAQGINDAGVVVGSAATGSFPEFGQALAWFPDGAGGWTTQFLGQLPGHTQSVAYDVNNRGDVVGWSITPGFQGGPTVWFNSPSGVLDLSALGAPSGPKEINDDGVIVGISGGLFDVDTLQATPLPPLPAGWSGFQGWAIGADGSLAGTGFHGGVSRSAAIWTPSGGWQSISPLFGISAQIQAFDVDASGLAAAEVPGPAARFPGVGTVGLATLLVPAQQPDWVFVQSLGSAVNAAGQIAAVGLNTATNEGGVVVLTPADGPTAYCTAKTSSAGCVAAIGTSAPFAQPTSGAADYLVTATGVQGLKNGLLFAGVSGPAALPFSGGTLCVNPPTKRGPVAASGGSGPTACDGGFATLVNDGAVVPFGLDAGPGGSGWYQYWYRDPQNGPGQLGTALSDAVRLDFD